jgi:hypothetical protein
LQIVRVEAFGIDYAMVQGCTVCLRQVWLAVGHQVGALVLDKPQPRLALLLLAFHGVHAVEQAVAFAEGQAVLVGLERVLNQRHHIGSLVNTDTALTTGCGTLVFNTTDYNILPLWA